MESVLNLLSFLGQNNVHRRSDGLDSPDIAKSLSIQSALLAHLCPTRTGND